MRERAVVQAAVTAQAAAEEAQADADQAATDAAAAQTAANAADARVDDVLDGTEAFTGLNVDSVGDVSSFLGRVDVGSGTVSTDALAANTVTLSEAVNTAGVLSLNGTTPVTIATKDITTTGGMVELSCGFFIRCEDAGSFTLTYRINRTTGMSTSLIWEQTIGGNATKDAGGDYLWIQLESIHTQDSPAAGTHTYYFEVVLSKTCTTQEVENRTLRVTEFRDQT